LANGGGGIHNDDIAARARGCENAGGIGGAQLRSRSSNETDWPASCQAAAMSIEQVVLPTPPFAVHEKLCELS